MEQKNRGRRRLGVVDRKKSIKHKRINPISADRGYYDEPERQFNFNDWSYIIRIVCIVLMILFVVVVVFAVCRVSYKMGYNRKFDEEYDIMYLQIHNSSYNQGYKEGSNEIGTEGIARKAKIIEAYRSLIEYEELSDETRKSYTKRLDKLLQDTLPREEEVKRFIKGVNNIISSDS